MSETGSQPIAEEKSFSFGQLKKMRKTDEFSSVFRFRCVSALSGIDFLAAPNGLNYSRLGMIVPKKIIATATARNRIKRLIRESFRLNQSELTGLDVVARVRSRTDETRLIDALQRGLKQCVNCLTSRPKQNVQAVKVGRL